MASTPSIAEEEVRRGVVKIVGEKNVVPGPEGAAWAVDGRVPKAVALPKGTKDVSALLAFANKNGLSVVPRGSGTKMELGGPPKRADVVLSLLHLNRVTEYEPADLVVTAEAGLKLADLQETLAKKGQWLPLDPPYRDATTLGGMVSSNSSGPLRYRFGPCRDWLLGVKVVTASGEVVRFGGKVVKNVAAYDMKKLFVGSLGSIGVLVELTFKLYPLPPAEQTFAALFDKVKDVAGFVTRVISSDLQPYAVEALNPEACGIVAANAQLPTPGRSYAVVLSFGDVEESVRKQFSAAQELGRSAGAVEWVVPDGRDGNAIWNSIRDLPRLTHQMNPGTLACKAVVPVSRSLDCCEALEQLGAKRGMACAFSSHAGNGVVSCYLSPGGGPGDAEFSAGAVREAREVALGMGGTLVIERAPSELKEKVDVWGPTGSDFQLMRALKERLDPRGVLSPGRFIGGI